MGRISDAFNSAFPDGPSSKPAQPDKAAVRIVGPVIEEELTGAAAGLVRAVSLTQLNARPGTRVGQPGEVTDGDDKGAYSWSGSAWVRVGDIIDMAAVADLQALTEPLVEENTGRFRVLDEDGWRVLETDPEKGVGIGGAWLRLLSTALMSVKDEEGWEFLNLDRLKGLGLGTFWLRPSASSLLRVMDAEGFIYFQIGADGLTKFIEGGSGSGGGSVEPASARRVWAGAVTEDSFTVCCDVEGSGNGIAKLIVSTDQYLTNRVYVSPVDSPDLTEKTRGKYWRSLRFKATGLEADTRYYYGVSVDGKIDTTSLHTVKTFPERHQPAPVRFIFGSCSHMPSKGHVAPAFSAAAKEDAHLFVHIGDLLYSNIDTDDILLPRELNTRAFRDRPSVKDLLATTAFAYVFDNHDSGGAGDCHWDEVYSTGATYPEVARNSRQAIFETTPNYPYVQTQLGETDPDKTILTQVIDIAQVRLIILDTRSQRRYMAGTPTCLGIGTNPPESWDQLGWLLNTALPQAAADAAAGKIKRLFVFSPSNWGPGQQYNGWPLHFPAEQTAICDALRDIPNLPATAILPGDLHFGAADDGTNIDFATGGGLTVPLFMSSPLERTGTLSSGGPFSWKGANGKFAPSNSRIYAVVDVDSAGDMTVTFKGAPFDANNNPTTLATYSSTDDTNKVAFVNATQSGAANAVVQVPVNKSWFGPVGGCTAQWTSSNGQSGLIAFNPNCGKEGIQVTMPASGSVTVTLSSPVRCVLGTRTTTTLTVV